MAKSVGSLYVDILAKVDTLEKDMARAKAAIGGADDSIRKAGKGAKDAYESFSLFNSFQGRGMLGIVSDMTAVTMAFQAIKREVNYVYDNINKIPGLSPQAVQSVNEFKVNLHEASLFMHKITADAMGGFFAIGKMIGTGFAMGQGYTADIPLEIASIDKLKEAEDPAYWDKVTQARTRLSAARKEESVASQTQAARVVELRVQAEQYETFSKAAMTSELARQEALTQASVKRKEANLLEVAIKEKYRTADQDWQREQQRDAMMDMTQYERIKRYQELYKEAWNFKVPNVTQDPSGFYDAMSKHLPNIILWSKSLRDELSKIPTSMRVMQDGFIQGFQQIDSYLTSFATGGTAKIQDFLKSLSDMVISTFLKLAIVNPLINAMFGGGMGGALLPAFFGIGAKADGGNGAGWTMVGERGPELVNLGASSYVLPAAETKSRLSGGSGGNIYQIDARGADNGVADRLQDMLLRLAGPGVVEQRALSATVNSRNRRQGM